MSKKIKSHIEVIVNTEQDFSMAQLYEMVWATLKSQAEVKKNVSIITSILGTKEYKKLSQGILRNTFLIELVKVPKIETTKFRVRWVDQLKDDPRWCSFEECLQIANDLLNKLPEWLEFQNHKDVIELSFSNSLIPYELPIDYQYRLKENCRLHTRGNVIWYYDELILRTLKLRKYLTNSSTSPDTAFFRKVLTDKIKVKTYLTDRVLTGEHKTNREKRWETNPNSVHFAERRICMAIEYALVTQICSFAGFPKEALENLQRANILPGKLTTALCPITGDALSYEEFRNELLNPIHGRSAFQVGHLNPLKLGSKNENKSGHTAENISWISADGNRIQGSLSLNDVRTLIRRIAENYNHHNW